MIVGKEDKINMAKEKLKEFQKTKAKKLEKLSVQTDYQIDCQLNSEYGFLSPIESDTDKDSTSILAEELANQVDLLTSKNSILESLIASKENELLKQIEKIDKYEQELLEKSSLLDQKDKQLSKLRVEFNETILSLNQVQLKLSETESSLSDLNIERLEFKATKELQLVDVSTETAEVHLNKQEAITSHDDSNKKILELSEENQLLKQKCTELEAEHLNHSRQFASFNNFKESLLYKKIENLENELDYCQLDMIKNGLTPIARTPTVDIAPLLQHFDSNEAITPASPAIEEYNELKAELEEMNSKLQRLMKMFNIQDEVSQDSYDRLITYLNQILVEWIQTRSELDEANAIIELQHTKIMKAMTSQENSNSKRQERNSRVSVSHDSVQSIQGIIEELKGVSVAEPDLIIKIIGDLEILKEMFQSLHSKLYAKTERLDFQISLNAEIKRLLVASSLPHNGKESNSLLVLYNDAKVEIGKLTEALEQLQ
ncbi:hypothetical protein BC833DRAFT_601649 [Globomyces pollinis-pini]|nr:hypothetical protein BC833DRAFT_601649 [Globomyces pollinis-pini]